MSKYHVGDRIEYKSESRVATAIIEKIQSGWHSDGNDIDFQRDSTFLVNWQDEYSQENFQKNLTYNQISNQCKLLPRPNLLDEDLFEI